jgi:hypothetical protein
MATTPTNSSRLIHHDVEIGAGREDGEAGWPVMDGFIAEIPDTVTISVGTVR